MEKKTPDLPEGKPSAPEQANSNLPAIIWAVKTTLLKGAVVRLIDFADEDRPYVIGAIAALRDEFPVTLRWVTIRESHLSETRLRAKSYHIKGEFLRSETQA
ncbi:hypothetical protein [Propionivibrio sp.]|uniref:hypothetical protein n=1 Tax=Propionivibrio sp. TaxID=2212460 RepID=UPI003BF159D8